MKAILTFGAILLFGMNCNLLAQQVFTDVTAAVGISGQTGLGHAVGWCDVDNDGDLDLAFSNQDESAMWLYENYGSAFFDDVTAQAGLAGKGTSVIIFADINGDEYSDLILSSNIFINNGDFTFTDITVSSGMEPYIRGAADFNNDGFIDIVSYNSAADFLFQLNNGDETFSDPILISSNSGYMSLVTFDYDSDGLMDIYVGTYGNDPNQLYKNNGDSTFTDVATAVNVAFAGRTHGVDAGDFNNDGFIDLYLGNYSAPGCLLYKNTGFGTFVDVTETAGVYASQETRTATFVDFYNDGLLDLFTSSHIPFTDPNNLFKNNGDGTFTDVAQEMGIGGETQGDYFGVGWGDYDNDGDQDLFAAGHFDKYRLYQNDNAPNNYLSVSLIGTNSNRSAFGARATAYVGLQKLTRFVLGKNGQRDFSDPRLHFGIGSAALVDSVVVKWTSGYSQTVANIDSNQFITIVEDENIPVELVGFFADNSNDGILLRWETAAETNNKGFEVLRSTSGNRLSGWVKIGFVEGNGTNAVSNKYSFTDENVKRGKYFYRLKQIDFDGSFEYSKIVEVDNSTPVKFELYQNYPNPFGKNGEKKSTTIEYFIPAKGNVKLAVYDMLGKKAAELFNGGADAGFHRFDFSPQNYSFSSGVYVYRLEWNGVVKSKKMLIINQ